MLTINITISNCVSVKISGFWNFLNRRMKMMEKFSEQYHSMVKLSIFRRIIYHDWNEMKYLTK